MDSIFDIESPLDVQKLSPEKVDIFIEQASKLIIECCLKNGGHWGANTSILETTVAILRVFNPEKNKILFDIGHNCYPYKIFTGRAKKMYELRNLYGLKGFQCIYESKYDHISQGNAGTASSNGIAMANNIDDKDARVISVVGDSTFGNGTVYEFFNHSSHIDKPFIFILNDNNASIGPVIGNIQGWHNGKKGDMHDKMPLFAKIFDFEYIGPLDGHNWQEVEKSLIRAKKLNKKVIVHVITKKGNRIDLENDYYGNKLHAISRPDGLKKWDQFISDIVVKNMEKNDKIDIVSSAMLYPTLLNKALGNKKIKNVCDKDDEFQNRVYNVGIAEAHASSFASGLALIGRKPYLQYQSAFVRRAFDNLLHDASIVNLNMVIGIGDVGTIENGNTHHGFYDLPMFSCMPNTYILQPSNKQEMEWAYNFAFNSDEEKIWVIRYSKYVTDYELKQKLPPNIKKEELKEPTWIKYSSSSRNKIAIISYGQIASVCRDIIQKEDLKIDLYSALWIKPLNIKLIQNIIGHYKKIFIIEETPKNLGLFSIIAPYVDSSRFKVWSYPSDLNLGFGDEEDLRHEYGLSYMRLKQKLKLE